MIKLLCVTGRLFPLASGGGQAVYNAIRLLCNHVEMHVFVVGYGPDNGSVEKMLELLPSAKACYFDMRQKDRYEKVHQACLRLRRIIQRVGRVRDVALTRELNLQVNLERHFNLYAALNAYIHTNDIDIVQFEFGSSLFWAQGITERVKKVFVQHEIQYVVEWQRLGLHPSHDQLMHWGICRNREILMQNGYDAVITLSEEDRQDCIHDGVKVPVYASFAKVEMREAIPLDYRMVGQPNLVFVGPEGHIPNRHGMQWFLDEVWSAVLTKRPQTRLFIVGNWSGNTRTAWERKYHHVEFCGFVDDLVQAMQGNILIVPIFEGSGIRMKILEAANVGVPFISTTIGARGLGFTHGENCWIADEANTFVEGLLQMLDDRDVLQRIAQTAHHHAHNHFSDERFVETRMKCYNEIM